MGGEWLTKAPVIDTSEVVTEAVCWGLHFSLVSVDALFERTECHPVSEGECVAAAKDSCDMSATV